MTPNYTTIITPIVAGHEAVLKQYLRDHAEPRLGCATSFLTCQPLFRFDKITSLHFCSFVVLDGEGDFDPCLVFEATFDGSRADFLRELWRVAPVGMHAVYEHCAGYPKSGLNVPQLIQDYLVRHDVGAHTFFSGCPGRSVAQVQDENRIRGEMVTYLSGRQVAAPDDLPALQQTLQRDVVRGRLDNRWAEQPAPVPWEVRNRNWVVGAVVGAAVLGLGILAVRAVLGVWPLALCGWIEKKFGLLWQLGLDFAQSGHARFGWLAGLTYELELPILYLLAALTVAWLLARGVELIVSGWTQNPRAQFFGLRLVLHLAFIFRVALPVFLVGLTALGLATNAPPLTAGNALPPATEAGRSRVGDLVVGSAWVSVGLLICLVALWLLLRYASTTLKLAVQFRKLPRWDENLRRLALDVIAFASVVVVLLAVLVFARYLPDWFARGVAKHANPLVYGYLVTVVYALAGVLTLYLVGSLLLLAVGGLERWERGKFEAAETLVTKPIDGHTWAREEGGINRYQNHLASLTYVKPWRRWLLRPTLAAINLLSRFWFNRGTLGGIPTILSARWVLIDRGRRLLFLDNYGGAWGSYLNEFIDMGAVKGLNAIWTNTFIKTPYSKQGHAWPQTSHYVWEGAQAEPAFKAYVRHSQIETIVWYSAYPTLSITNVNTNTELRQSLFEPLAPCDLDCIIQRL